MVLRNFRNHWRSAYTLPTERIFRESSRLAREKILPVCAFLLVALIIQEGDRQPQRGPGDARRPPLNAHSGSDDGASIPSLRSPISSAATVAAIPPGYDVAATTYVYVDSGGNDQLYFDRLKCSGKYYADLYEVPNAQNA